MTTDQTKRSAGARGTSAGGGEGTGTPPPTPTPVETAIAAYEQIRKALKEPNPQWVIG